jgi:hypothetical protein
MDIFKVWIEVLYHVVVPNFNIHPQPQPWLGATLVSIYLVFNDY